LDEPEEGQNDGERVKQFFDDANSLYEEDGRT
jgi:hypothetical protein